MEADEIAEIANYTTKAEGIVLIHSLNILESQMFSNSVTVF